MQQFLIIYESNIWTTDWFAFDDNYKIGMIVVNLYKATYTRNGQDWFKLPQDNS